MGWNVWKKKVLDRKEAHLNEAIMQNRRELSQRHGYYPGICICDSGHHDAEIWRRGTDPMQCSESPYNTRFSHSPGSITDPNYSIEVGVQTFADCISQAGCSSPQDMDKLNLHDRDITMERIHRMGAAKRRIHRSQCFTIFTGTGSFARMEQLRRSPIRSPCDAVLFRWQPVCLVCLVISRLCRLQWGSLETVAVRSSGAGTDLTVG